MTIFDWARIWAKDMILWILWGFHAEGLGWPVSVNYRQCPAFAMMMVRMWPHFLEMFPFTQTYGLCLEAVRRDRKALRWVRKVAWRGRILLEIKLGPRKGGRDKGGA